VIHVASLVKSMWHLIPYLEFAPASSATTQLLHTLTLTILNNITRILYNKIHTLQARALLSSFLVKSWWNILNNSGSKAWESFEMRERIFEISLLHNPCYLNIQVQNLGWQMRLVCCNIWYVNVCLYNVMRNIRYLGCVVCWWHVMCSHRF